MGLRIDYKQLQDLTGCTYKTVKRRLDEAEVKSIGTDGKSIIFDSAEALAAIFRGKEDGGDDVRKLLTAEQHREKKRENDIAEGLIAPISLITESIMKAGSIIMANLEALPGMMKRSNPELTAHDINAVKKTISKCCQAISEMRTDVN